MVMRDGPILAGYPPLGEFCRAEDLRTGETDPKQALADANDTSVSPRYWALPPASAADSPLRPIRHSGRPTCLTRAHRQTRLIDQQRRLYGSRNHDASGNEPEECDHDG